MTQAPSIKLIAEVASAHEGDKSKLFALIDAAAEAGADLIKFQIFETDAFVSVRNSNYLTLKGIELNRETWMEAFQLSETKGLAVVAEPYDLDSLAWIVNLGFITYLKIPATALGFKKFLLLCQQFSGVLFLGCGGSSLSEVHEALEVLSRNNVVLTLGFQNFPTSLSDSNLRQILQFSQLSGVDLAYADHVDGNNDRFKMFVPMLAAALGAKYIEKHLTLSRVEKGLDYYSSLNPEELRDLKQLLLAVNTIMGSTLSDDLTEAEYSYRTFSKLSAISSRFISKGEEITDSMVSFKRDDELGIGPQDISDSYRVVAKQDIAEGQLVKMSMVKIF